VPTPAVATNLGVNLDEVFVAETKAGRPIAERSMPWTEQVIWDSEFAKTKVEADPISKTSSCHQARSLIAAWSYKQEASKDHREKSRIYHSNIMFHKWQQVAGNDVASLRMVIRASISGAHARKIIR